MDDQIRFRRRLLTWFRKHRRELPWRADRDPYRIWISEVMLQQTTVAAVVPYFQRFLVRFPDLHSLAAADEREVLHHWQGLGYYRRARHLHAAARQLVMEHDGQLPDDVEIWAALPGVGRYILGAVLSQAFDRRMPIVEANTLRVLSRLFASRLDPRVGDGKAWVWRAAKELLPRRGSGDFNQAMMELGALICAPVNPKCDACPARRDCAAFERGLQNVIPPAPKKMEWEQVEESAVIIERAGRVLIAQRLPTAKRGAMLWEFPADAARVGLQVKLGGELATIRHGVTRFRITLVGRVARWRNGEYRCLDYAAGVWASPEELPGYPMSTPQGKLRSAWLKRMGEPAP